MKKFFVEHWEKGVVGLAVFTVVAFMYGAVTATPYERVPADFSSVASSALKNVESGDPKTITGLDYVDLAELNKDVAKPVSPDPFKYDMRWIRQTDFGFSFRGEPVVLKPGKPAVQDNRGLLVLFKTNEDGERLTRKVAKSQAVFAKAAAKPGKAMKQPRMRMGGYGGGGSMAGGTNQGANFMSKMGGMGGNRGGNMMSGAAGADQMQQMMGGAGMGGMGGMGMGGMGMDMGDMAMNPMMMGMSGNEEMLGDAMPQNLGEDSTVELAPEPVRAKSERTQRFVLPKDMFTKEKEDEKKKDKDKDGLIEEYIEEMIGKHWVEIVASFPHSKQIEEFVQKLHEPAQRVGLRYAVADVERRELLPNLEWSSWYQIPLLEQFRVIENAVAYAPEPFPQVVMKGLAMNIPFLQSTYKPYLSLPEFDRPEMAEYPPEIINPQMAVRNMRAGLGPANAARPRNGAPPARTLSASKQEVDLSVKGLNESAGKRAVFENRFEVKNAMIRFWDFTVEPGRRYQYRVRVRTFNPNANRSDVSDASFAQKTFLVGEWSEPSDDVVVERDTRWYAAPKQQVSNNTKATVEIHHWSEAIGEWVPNTFTHRPGDVVGVSGRETPVKWIVWAHEKEQMSSWQVQDTNWIRDNLSKLGETAAKLFRREPFDTKTVLLDITGGRQRVNVGDNTFEFRVPKEIIVVNEFGDLVKRDEEADGTDRLRKAIVDDYEKLIAEQTSKRSDNAGFNVVDPTAGKTKGTDKSKGSDKSKPIDPTSRTKN